MSSSKQVARVEYKKHYMRELYFVSAEFYENGSSSFSERSTWDVYYHDFDPCNVERAFAKRLVGAVAPDRLPLLKLDTLLEHQKVVDWVAEADWVTRGLAELDLALKEVSLGSVTGEHRLSELVKAVKEGRLLARSFADMENARERWLKRVDALRAASNGKPPSRNAPKSECARSHVCV